MGWRAHWWGGRQVGQGRKRAGWGPTAADCCQGSVFWQAQGGKAAVFQQGARCLHTPHILMPSLPLIHALTELKFQGNNLDCGLSCCPTRA